MYLGKDKEHDTFELGNISLNESKQEVIFGFTIFDKLSFNSHIQNTIRNLSNKFVHYLEF